MELNDKSGDKFSDELDDKFDMISKEIHHDKVKAVNLSYSTLTPEGPLLMYDNDFKFTQRIINVLHDIFQTMKQELEKGTIITANVCGNNSVAICDRLGGESLHGHTLDAEEIFILEWQKDWEKVQLPAILGDNTYVVGASYHALVHFICYSKHRIYYIACDSVFAAPYLFQFYIADTEEDLFAIIMKRYLARGIYLYPCENSATSHRLYTYQYKLVGEFD